MKLDKDTYLLAQDIYLRNVTNPNYKGDNAKSAVEAIRSSVTFFSQWEAMQAQVAAAANHVVENSTPAPVESLSSGIKKANGERQKLSEAPKKELRGQTTS
jgi:pyrroloquinoline quinone (PQQ) biosynthesis protein C